MVKPVGAGRERGPLAPLVEPVARRGVRRRAASSRRVSVERVLDEPSVAMFYALYLTAFGPMRTRAAARHVLREDEFAADMTDPRVDKYVAWSSDGAPVGLTTLTNDLTAVPWISPEYFAAQFPEHTTRGAVYYLGFTLVDPRARGATVFHDMMAHVLQRLVAERAVVACDIAAYNNTVHSFDANLVAMLTATAEVNVEVLDTQTYYAAGFTGPAA